MVPDRYDVPRLRSARPSEQRILAERRRLNIAALSHPHDLATRRERILDALQHVRAIHEIEAFVSERERVNIGYDERHIRDDEPFVAPGCVVYESIG